MSAPANKRKAKLPHKFIELDAEMDSIAMELEGCRLSSGRYWYLREIDGVLVATAQVLNKIHGFNVEALPFTKGVGTEKISGRAVVFSHSKYNASDPTGFDLLIFGGVQPREFHLIAALNHLVTNHAKDIFAILLSNANSRVIVVPVVNVGGYLLTHSPLVDRERLRTTNDKGVELFRNFANGSFFGNIEPNTNPGEYPFSERESLGLGDLLYNRCRTHRTIALNIECCQPKVYAPLHNSTKLDNQMAMMLTNIAAGFWPETTSKKGKYLGRTAGNPIDWMYNTAHVAGAFSVVYPGILEPTKSNVLFVSWGSVPTYSKALVAQIRKIFEDSFHAPLLRQNTARLGSDIPEPPYYLLTPPISIVENDTTLEEDTYTVVDDEIQMFEPITTYRLAYSDEDTISGMGTNAFQVLVLVFLVIAFVFLRHRISDLKSFPQSLWKEKEKA